MKVPIDPDSREVGLRHPLLCAVDQSTEAREAADVAAGLAARLDAPLVLAHVLPDRPAASLRLDDGSRAPRGDSLEAAQLFLEHLTSDSAPGCQARVRLAFGDPFERVLALADEEDAQMLVVGSRGRGAFRVAILGGVSSRLAAGSSRPVVVVPPGGAGKFQRSLPERAPSVVCGVDGSSEAERLARYAADLAARLGLRLVLMHVYGERPGALGVARSGPLPHDGAIALESDRRSGRDVLDRLAQLLEPKVEVSLRLLSGDPAAALKRGAAQECAALIVAGSRGRGPLTSALLSSVSTQLAAAAGRPVMVVPEQAQNAPAYAATRAHFDRRST